MDLQRAKEVEVRRRRRGAPHPDLCPKLRLHGVDFAVAPRGLHIRPRFDDDGRAEAEFVGEDRYPQAVRLCGRLRRRLRRRRLTVDGGLLGELMALGRSLLLTQYDLTDAEAADLLSFPADQSPVWISDLVRWMQGPSSTPPNRPRRRWFRPLTS